MRVLLLLALTSCVTPKVEAPRVEIAKRDGQKVQCAPIANGPATEVCVYPLGVLCFGGDKGISCLQPLPISGGPG